MHGIEGNRGAVKLARRNVPEAKFTSGDVGRFLSRWPNPVDLVILDPPRSGAGRSVMVKSLSIAGRAVAYVACDPAALARDLRIAKERGWNPVSIRAFDLFPLTHHVELVAILAAT